MAKNVASLSRSDRRRLKAFVADGNTAQKIVKRVQIILLSAEGHGTSAIMRAVGVSQTTVWRWQEYFIEAGVDGLVKGPLQAARHEAVERGRPAGGGREDDVGTSRRGDPLERPHDGGDDGHQPYQRAAHLA